MIVYNTVLYSRTTVLYCKLLSNIIPGSGAKVSKNCKICHYNFFDIVFTVNNPTVLYDYYCSVLLRFAVLSAKQKTETEKYCTVGTLIPEDIIFSPIQTQMYIILHAHSYVSPCACRKFPSGRRGGAMVVTRSQGKLEPKALPIEETDPAAPEQKHIAVTVKRDTPQMFLRIRAHRRSKRQRRRRFVVVIVVLCGILVDLLYPKIGLPCGGRDLLVNGGSFDFVALQRINGVCVEKRLQWKGDLDIVSGGAASVSAVEGSLKELVRFGKVHHGATVKRAGSWARVQIRAVRGSLRVLVFRDRGAEKEKVLTIGESFSIGRFASYSLSTNGSGGAVYMERKAGFAPAVVVQSATAALFGNGDVFMAIDEVTEYLQLLGKDVRNSRLCVWIATFSIEGTKNLPYECWNLVVRGASEVRRRRHRTRVGG